MDKVRFKDLSGWLKFGMISAIVMGLLYSTLLYYSFMDSILEETPLIEPYHSIDETYDFILASRESLPILYGISKDCSDFMKGRIRDAFDILGEKTDYILSFAETTSNQDIEISCSPLDFSEDEDYYYYTVGESTLGVIGYLTKESVINFYNFESEEEVWEMGGCIKFPDTEIHEILHTFGFDHNDNVNSIMSPSMEGCSINSIDKYIIECLKYTYTDEEEGVDCSNREDVVSSIEDVEYEYELFCEDGLYESVSDGDWCCPEPGMYIDSDGYCE